MFWLILFFEKKMKGLPFLRFAHRIYLMRAEKLTSRNILQLTSLQSSIFFNNVIDNTFMKSICFNISDNENSS